MGARLRMARVAADAAASLAACLALERARGPSLERAQGMFQAWCRRALRTFAVEARLSGELPAGPCVLVANHRGYVDVLVAGALLRAAFVSRADVADWPVVGPAARVIGTVFVERESTAGRARGALGIARLLDRRSVLVFAEGTTGAERLPRELQAGLFRLLWKRGATVVPLTLRYSDRRVYWADGSRMGDHLRALLSRREAVRAEARVGRPLEGGACADPEALRAAVYAALCAPIEEEGELIA